MMDGAALENRTVRALRRLPVDRVPVLEFVINGRFIKFATGEVHDTSLDIPPKTFIKLAQFMNMDLVSLGYVSRVPGINTREQFEKLELRPQDLFLKRVDEYSAALEGTGIGLNIYVHGPFDATYLTMGYESFFYMLADDPGLVEEMMDLYTEDAVKMVNELLARNPATIQLVDDIAYKSGMFIRPELFKEMWFKRMGRIMEPIHRAGMTTFFHSDGKVDKFIEMVIALGFHGINPIEPVCNDITAIKKKYGKDIALIGNLDIGGVLSAGTPDDVRKEMKALLKEMMPGEGYVAACSNTLYDAVIPENYMAMIETVLDYGSY